MSKDKFQDKYRIESARAKWHDYDNGFYFVTICTKNREYFFGTIQNTEMVLSETGKYLKQQLQTIGEHYLYAEIPLWTIMPNHIHLIVSIDGGCLPHKKRNIPILEKNSHSENVGMECATNKQSWLSVVIRQIKQSVTRFAKQNNIEFYWQSSFHDYIIRNQKEMDLISEYIENNVRKWEEDCFYINP